MATKDSTMYWSFALVNNRLAEVFYEMKRGKPYIFGHCYVKKIEYKTKREQNYIRQDTQKFRFTWKNQKYTQINPVIAK